MKEAACKNANDSIEKSPAQLNICLKPSDDCSLNYCLTEYERLKYKLNNILETVKEHNDDLFQVHLRLVKGNEFPHESNSKHILSIKATRMQ